MLPLILLPLLAGSAAAFGAYNKQQPVPETQADNFTWSDPFESSRLRKLTPVCTAEQTFAAHEFLLHDLYLQEPEGLWPYAETLKRAFAGRPYPGGWAGRDPHHYARPLLRMDYDAVPVAVRRWIEAQTRDKLPGQGLFAVLERSMDQQKVHATVKPAPIEKAEAWRPLDARRVVIFAPGALYQILPLWVAEESSCRDSLLDLDRYTPKPRDGGTIAWTTDHGVPDRQKNERGMTFAIRAQVLKGTDSGKAHVQADKEL